MGIPADHMKAALTLALFLAAPIVNAERIAIYLTEPEAQQMIETLSRDNLTRTERILAGKYLPWGLQSWPGMEEVQPLCKRKYLIDGRIWYKIIVDPPTEETADVSVSKLAALLHSIALHTEDGAMVLRIEWLALLVRQCGEAAA